MQALSSVTDEWTFVRCCVAAVSWDQFHLSAGFSAAVAGLLPVHVECKPSPQHTYTPQPRHTVTCLATAFLFTSHRKSLVWRSAARCSGVVRTENSDFDLDDCYFFHVLVDISCDLLLVFGVIYSATWFICTFVLLLLFLASVNNKVKSSVSTGAPCMYVCVCLSIHVCVMYVFMQWWTIISTNLFYISFSYIFLYFFFISLSILLPHLIHILFQS